MPSRWWAVRADREAALRAQLVIIAERIKTTAVEADVETVMFGREKAGVSCDPETRRAVELGTRIGRMEGAARDLADLIDRFLPQPKRRKGPRR